MVTFPPDLDEVLRSLQWQIDEINTARPGPTAYGPGDGHLRFYTATGDTFYADATGAQVKHRGALTGLTELTEGHTATLEAHSGRLTIYGQEISGLGTRMGSAESDIAAHGTRLTAYGQAITGLGTRMGSAESDISGLRSSKADVSYVDTVNSRAGAAASAASTAQSRADSAYSRAGTGISDAATAKARADAAYSLAAGRATDGDVSNALATAKQYTDSRINALVGALRNAGIDFIF